MKRILLSAALAGLVLSSGPALADGSSTVSPELVRNDVASSSAVGMVPVALLFVIALGLVVAD